MQGRTTPYVLGAAVLIILAIVGGYFLFKGKPEANIAQTERIQPAATPAPLTEETVPARESFAAPELELVYFDFDRYNIRPDARKPIQDNTAWLKEHPKTAVRLEGHCDERGTEEYNLVLGERRADAVRNVLVKNGIDKQRISTISYGKSRPVVPNATTEAEHQRNRRVVFDVSKLN